ncbi:hypothetical protein JD419_17645 [Morganella morganii subsp. morganii]|uniref:hypothetical protein n=1 Tax=Morganella morganii TaxID=582 RepID=UPI001BD3B957|nr:hypothetical protein [Morganella morganii]MBS9543936.1 hypothetical protein [Morganella morganii subsp. morganii]
MQLYALTVATITPGLFAAADFAFREIKKCDINLILAAKCETARTALNENMNQ